jgi:LmbE family N-acetylglucosaminyl deacetylase
VRARYLLCFLLLLLGGVRAGAAETDFTGELTPRMRLQRLNVLGTVLMIGAHDDDDDTQLLSYLSGELHLRTAYLSLARGSGAQNQIGSEQGDAMGVLITQEALASRRIQNVEQFYTRAVDFGFSKTLAEGLERWDRPEIVGDIVWVVRRLRPDLVIIRYSGTARDGHGQHQASAVLGRKALIAAADPQQFPEQLKSVGVWSPKRVFDFSAVAGSAARPVQIAIGGFNSELNRSYGEIAALSRRSFRSQAMNPTVAGNSRQVSLWPQGARTVAGLLDDIDTTWGRVMGAKSIGDMLAAALRNFERTRPSQSLRALLSVRKEMESMRTTASDPWLELKRSELDELIARVGGIFAHATSNGEVVTPGDTVSVTAEIELPGSTGVVIQRATLVTPSGEKPMAFAAAPTSVGVSCFEARGDWVVADSQGISQPYWLVRDDEPGMPRPNPTIRGYAEDRPLLSVRFSLRSPEGEFELVSAVHSIDQSTSSDNSTRPLIVAPAVTVRPVKSVVLFPEDAAKTLSVAVTAERNNATGAVRLQLPSGWKSEPAAAAFALATAGMTQNITFSVTPPSEAGDGFARVVATVGGHEISMDRRVVAYPHIERKTFFPPAEVRLVRVPLRIKPLVVGYIMGSGDEIPASLEQLGCSVTLLTPELLVGERLPRYDVIVLGIRAYNLRPDLLAQAGRLRSYVEEGGTLIMQYTVSPQGPNAPVNVPDLGPYPFEIGSTRVTVENSPVGFALPGHSLLHYPNQITAEDFSGWVQERGLHFALQWDPRYETPLSTKDPGEPDLLGGVLFARHGKGVFIYTSYAWFRQLPAGVPGAYRIFANLVSAGQREP